MPIQPPLPSFTVPPNPTDVFMVDIETAGTETGAAIIEIGAAEFNPSTGEILREWSIQIDLLDSTRLGLVIEPDTAAFHLNKKFEGDLRGATLWRAMNAIWLFLHLHSEKIEVWAWGMDFESRHFAAACKAVNYPFPWHYKQSRDARTVWELAFPGKEHDHRPHRAADDVRAQIADLTAAMANLQRKA